jgi:DNA polymerase III epsilon subunit-like protein
MMQKKIDKRITYKVVLDCESCPLDRTLEEVLPSNMFAYDIGWAIVDKRGNVYAIRSFIVAEIFYHEKELMQSSYYAEKIPKYKEDIASGKRTVATFYEIRKQLADDMKLYGIKEVYAHNMRFDYGTLNNTQRWLTKSKYRYFFPYGTEICDTLKMSRQVIGKMPTYRTFCEEHGYLTKKGQLRFTAEIIYRFITKDEEFTESHTGLEDVLIEKEILAYCYRQHKKMVRQLWG